MQVRCRRSYGLTGPPASAATDAGDRGL